MTMAVLIGMFAATLLIGCAAQNMNGSMDSSTDTMSEEKMDSGMGTMPENERQNMQTDDMEKTMK